MKDRVKVNYNLSLVYCYVGGWVYIGGEGVPSTP
jgi:hypothetical protein